jgi:type VI secretion system secreted protein Hcp
MVRSLVTLVTIFAVGLPASRASAAETVHLYLKANGSDIKGESTQESLGRKDSIECTYYVQKVITAREAGTGMATGRRQYEPLLCRKRIDKASPRLLQALVENAKVDGVFRFFRPSPKGDGTTQHFYTVQFQDGRIASMEQVLPDTTAPATQSLPPEEEMTIVFHSITWTYTDGGVSASDTWSQNK